MHYTLSDYLIDLVQNSVEAKASVIDVSMLESDRSIKITIADNGKGMDEAVLSRVRDPFFTEAGKHDKRKVGLGLSFLAQFISQCSGTWDITSQKGVGTSLFFNYSLKNIDAPPAGNLVSAIVTLMGLTGEFELTFNRTLNDDSYAVSRSEVIDALGDLSDAHSLIALRKYLKSLEDELSETSKVKIKQGELING
ncbi:MAG: sensor histidine kinase [Chitinispirillia bacterium]|nr:sensor histidine kinase [Chitinispirillia bacterium]